MRQKPVVLMVLDGYGLSDNHEANAVYMAKTPVMDKLMAECPFQKGYASGLAVGLPDGQMGNSEVGHMNIGSGRIIYQDLTLITKYIEEGTLFKNEELLRAINNCKEHHSDLHIWDCSQTAECTATIHICTVCWSSAKRRALRMFICIPSLTAGIRLPLPERIISRSSLTRRRR